MSDAARQRTTAWVVGGGAEGGEVRAPWAPEVFMCVEVKPLSVFLPPLSLYDGMELMMACRYFSCSRLVESAWEGTAEEHHQKHKQVNDQIITP